MPAAILPPSPRALSSVFTPLYRFVFPTLAAALGTFFAIVMPNAPDLQNPLNVRWQLLGMTAVGSAFLYWQGMRLKSVALVGEEFVISDYGRSTHVSLSDVDRISASRFSGPETVTIHVSRETPFGTTVTFMAPIRFSFGFSEHPLAAELRHLIAVRRRANPDPRSLILKP